jgi:hypothetical protein
MASAYVIWDRSSRTFVGGAAPLVYTVSADATAQAQAMSDKSNRAADSHRKPVPVFDVVTVTVP